MKGNGSHAGRILNKVSALLSMWFLVLPMELRDDAHLMPHDDLIFIMIGYSPDENDIYDYASAS